MQKWATVTRVDVEKQINLCIRDNWYVRIDEIASEVNVGRGKNQRKITSDPVETFILIW
jgi:hypothetical protein